MPFTGSRKESCAPRSCFGNPVKTLFLDFDGVLHPTLAIPGQLFAQASLLVEPLLRWRPQVVISSSWRFQCSGQELLTLLPPEVADCVVGVTGPAHVGQHARWHEIEAYCARHHVEDWRALDDSAFEFPSNCPSLIRCNGARGLTTREVQLMVSWLGGATLGAT